MAVKQYINKGENSLEDNYHETDARLTAKPEQERTTVCDRHYLPHNV